MKQYIDLLQNIIDNGVEKESARANLPNTIGISHASIEMDIQDGFPLLTTKKMFLRGIIHELLWILRGETNVKYLIDNGINIWSGDAYRWYLKNMEEYKNEIEFKTIDEFINAIKSFEKLPFYNFGTYQLGDLGKVYGYQWRNQNGVDQVRDVIEGLRDNPYSRYHIIDGWNAVDRKEQALPPCHLLYQFIVRPLSFKERRDLAKVYAVENNELPLAIDAHGDKGGPIYMKVIDNTGWNIPKFYLDLNMYQRSCDSACGIPFNLASMSLLLMLFAKVSNMIPGKAYWTGGDTHLYIPHIEKAKEQIERTPYKLPTLEILKDIKSLEDILALSVDDFKLEGYESHPKVEFELFAGNKK